MRKLIIVLSLAFTSFNLTAQEDVCKDRVSIENQKGREIMFSKTIEANELSINIWKILDFDNFPIFSITLKEEDCVLKGSKAIIKFKDGSIAEIVNINQHNCEGRFQFIINEDLKNKLATSDIINIHIKGLTKDLIISKFDKSKNISLRQILYCIYN